MLHRCAAEYILSMESDQDVSVCRVRELKLDLSLKSQQLKQLQVCSFPTHMCTSWHAHRVGRSSTAP